MLKAKGDAKEAKDTDVPPKTTPGPAMVKVVRPSRSTTPIPETKLGFSVNGDSIIATIGACPATMSKQDAIKAYHILFSLLIE
ncbi:MAG TPA: hypothetical protein VKM55_29985 [Candidatus Lokiarchaeia archaeon]|nr:hypothetical protein [Candidatus Lokiarchaeia archaeon]